MKAVDPDIRVIGLGLSPRGNDRPTAPSNVSTSPVRFLTALGAWYRASGRQRPLMDGLSFHPYPESGHGPGHTGLRVAQRGRRRSRADQASGVGRVPRTAQPTTVNGLKLYLDEVGWQVDTSKLVGYSGVENVRVTNERTQARIYNALVRSVSCDPQVAELNFFGFYDDSPRGTGFQAALNRVDGTPRASAGAVQSAIAATAAGAPLRGRGIPPSA